MADVAISGLTALGAAPAVGDLLAVVDISDTTQAPTGTTKKMTTANLFTSPSMTTVTVASGGLTVTSGGLTVTAGTTAVQALTATTGTFSGTINATGTNGLGIGGPAGRRRLQSTSSTAFSLVTDLDSSADLAMGALSATSGSFNSGLNVSGGTLTAAATAFSGDLAIATSKFTVAAASGNTAVAGTLAVTGAITATGGVSGALNVTGDFTVATSKLVVSASTGNLALIGDISASAGAAQIALTVAFGGLGASYGWLNCKTTAGVTTATVISPNNTFAKGGIALVYGSDGTNKFSDLVHYGTTAATAVAAQTLAGAPAARTYTMASNTLKLAMASGTYSIETTEMYKGT